MAGVDGASKETQDDSLTCPMCLEVFTSPKILPCFHTFCEKCLESLVVSQPGTTFPCPSCREVITVPSAGVSAFKANFYIKPEDLDKARRGLFCGVHARRELELFCVDCDVCICLMCKVTDHLTHKAQDIQQTLNKARSQLSDDRTRLTKAVLTVQERIDEVVKEQEAVKRKKETVEKNIHNRYTTVVAAAARVRDEALASLENITSDINYSLSSLMTKMQENLSQLRKLQQQVTDCKSSGSVTRALKMVMDMKEGDGSQAVVEKLTSERITALSRQVLQCKDTDQEIMQGMQGYMGKVVQADMEPCVPEIEMKEFIHCGGQRPDCEVFCVCPEDDDTVSVSYNTSVLCSEARNPEQFDEDGTVIDTLESLTGKTCLKVNALTGFFYQAQGEKIFLSYAKSDKLILLTGPLKGKVKVQSISMISEEPFETKLQTEFTVLCGKHRACDVDDNKEFLVVVEEAQTPHTHRRVLLFQRPHLKPVDVYTPPAVPIHTHTVPHTNQDLDATEMSLTQPSLPDMNTKPANTGVTTTDAPVTKPLLSSSGDIGLTEPLTNTSLLQPLTHPDVTLSDTRLPMTDTTLTEPSVTTSDEALKMTDTPLTDSSFATSDTPHRKTGTPLAKTDALPTDPCVATSDTPLPNPSLLPSPPSPVTDPGTTSTDMPSSSSSPALEELLFQPSDVCFYRLGGQEVVLVSDEARDAVHVLHVQEGKLRFLRYLAPGCPLLLQPTALNVDSKGRLWVACRGGSILVCTPLDQSVHC